MFQPSNDLRVVTLTGNIIRIDNYQVKSRKVTGKPFVIGSCGNTPVPARFIVIPTGVGPDAEDCELTANIRSLRKLSAAREYQGTEHKPIHVETSGDNGYVRMAALACETLD